MWQCCDHGLIPNKVVSPGELEGKPTIHPNWEGIIQHERTNGCLSTIGRQPRTSLVALVALSVLFCSSISVCACLVYTCKLETSRWGVEGLEKKVVGGKSRSYGQVLIEGLNLGRE